jgi:non-homologous end joining protein Ku
MTPKEQKLNALQYELSRRFEAARVAQAALMAEQTRQGLAVTREFYTADEMIAERIASRLELREIAKAVITDCRMRWDRSYVPTPLEAAIAQWPAAFAAAKQAQAAPKAEPDNVISLAQQISVAGKKRRGESS